MYKELSSVPNKTNRPASGSNTGMDASSPEKSADEEEFMRKDAVISLQTTVKWKHRLPLFPLER